MPRRRTRKRTQTPRQRAASLRNLAKARAARRRKTGGKTTRRRKDGRFY